MAYQINTINEFLALPVSIQGEIQKALRMKERLYSWLRDQNKKALRAQEPSRWIPCPRCTPGGHPGWYYVQEEERDNSDIHPSQITKCIRKLYYDCNGSAGSFEENIDPQLRMLFDMGHTWHHTVQGYGRRGAWGNKEYYKFEVPFDPDMTAYDGTPLMPIAQQYWFKGSVDGILSPYEVPAVPGIGDVSIRVVHEYKTMSSASYGKLTRPKPEHKMQATIYSAVFDIPFVVYLYTNKDNNQMADFPVPFDLSIWNEIRQRVEKVQHYVITETPPPWEETAVAKNPLECKDCGYLKICQPPVGGRR